MIYPLKKKYNSNKNILLIISFLFLSFFSACTKEISRQVHEEKLSAETIWERADLNISNTKEINELEVEFRLSVFPLIEKGEEIRKDSRKLMEEVIKPLSDKLLSYRYLENGHLNSSGLIDVFSKFNEFLLIALRNVSTRKSALSIVDEYNKIIFSACDDNLSNCKNVDFFRNVNDIKLIVLSKIHYADSNERCAVYEDIEKYYKRIKMSYVFSSEKINDPLINFYYLQCGVKHLRDLSNKYNNESSAVIAEQIESIFLDLESIIDSDKKLLEDNKDAKSIYYVFIGELEKLLSGIDNENIKKERIYNIKDKIFYSILEVSDDNKYIMETINSDYERSYDEDEYSYHFMVEKIQEKSPNIFRNMNVDILNKDNILLQSLSNAINGKFSVFLWSKIYKRFANEEELKRVARSFLNVLILYQVVEANGKLAPLLKDQKITSDVFLEKLFSLHRDITSKMHQAYRILEKLKRVVGLANISINEIEKIGLDESNFLTTMDYLLSYPHTILIGRKLSELKYIGEYGQISYKGDTGVKIRDPYSFRTEHFYHDFFFKEQEQRVAEGDVIIDYFFNLRPMVIFNSYEKLYSVAFLIKTGILSAIDLTAEEFLKELFEGMLKEYNALLKDSYAKLFDVNQFMGMDINKAIYVCEEEKKRKQYAEEGKSYTPSYSFELSILDLKSGSFANADFFINAFQVNEKLNTPSQRENLVLMSQNEISNVPFTKLNMERLDQIRLGASKTERHLDFATEIYRNFRLKTSSLDPEIIEQEISTLREPIERYKHEKRKFYTLLRKNNKLIVGACNNLFLERALQLSDSVYWKEIEYLRNVYSKKIESINIPENSREIILDDYYVYNRPDSIRRIKSYLTELAPEIKIVETDSKYDYYNSIMNPSKAGSITGISFFDSREKLLSEDEFVKSAMKKFLWQKSFDYYKSWDSVIYDRIENYAKNFLPYLILIYKLGDVEFYALHEDDTTCLESERYDSRICSIQKDSFVDLNRIVDINLEYSRLISISEQQEDLFRLLSLTERYLNLYDDSQNIFTGYLYRPYRGGKEMAFLDYAYILLARSPYFGLFMNVFDMSASWSFGHIRKVKEGKWRDSIWKDMKSYQLYLESLDKFLFSADKSTIDYFTSKFRKVLENELQEEKDFLNIVKEKEENAEEVFVGFDFEKNQPIYNRRSHRGDMLRRERSYGPYLDSKIVADRKEDIRKFNEETRYLFYPEGKK